MSAAERVAAVVIGIPVVVSVIGGLYAWALSRLSK